jgi:hypothetical protein
MLVSCPANQPGLYGSQTDFSSLVKTFTTTTADPITITVTTDIYSTSSSIRVSPKDEEPSLETSLKCNSIL